MAIQTSYTQPLPSDTLIGSEPGTTMYALVIPAGSLLFSGAAVRLSLHAAANFSNVWLGHLAGEGLDFDGAQVQLKKNAAGSFAVNGVAVLDAVAFALDETKPLVLRFDAASPGNYKKATGLSSEFAYYYKAGAGGGSNGNTTAPSGYEASAAGRTAFVTQVEVGDVADFAPPVEPNEPTPVASGDIEAVLNNEIFESGGRVEGQPGKHLIFALFVPAGSGVIGVPVEVEVTPNEDCDFTVRSIENNTGTLMPSRCNSNFRINSVLAPPSKAKLYYSHENTPLGNNTAQHAYKTARAGITKVIHAEALAAIHPGELGFAIALPPGVGAAFNILWHEKIV